MDITSLETERLLLRRWKPSDQAPFAAMNADPVVMEYFPSTLTRAESDAFARRVELHFESHGYGLWAVEVADTGSFAGFVGLAPATFDAHFTPAVEVGWRLDTSHWGRGYAPEAARRVLDDGFGRLGLDEIVSFTAATNLRSRRVMEKIGMTHDGAGDFDHPSVPEGSPLRRHVLYRLRRPAAR
jgi:ribosomal-protein-alanine N-acetyltransferase